MARDAPSRVCQFTEVGWGFHGLLICSEVFLAPRWMMLKKVLGVSAVRRGPYLVTKPSEVGVDVDGTSCSLHHPLAMGVGLAYRVFGLGRFFLAWSPSHSLAEFLPFWAHTP
jgi:hypothetical protein